MREVLFLPFVHLKTCMGNGCEVVRANNTIRQVRFETALFVSADLAVNVRDDLMGEGARSFVFSFQHCPQTTSTGVLSNLILSCFRAVYNLLLTVLSGSSKVSDIS